MQHKPGGSLDARGISTPYLPGGEEGEVLRIFEFRMEGVFYNVFLQTAE